MPSELTPEEKLLKLIKNGHSKAGLAPAIPSPIPETSEGKPTPFRTDTFRHVKQSSKINGASIALSVLWVAIILLLAALGYQFTFQTTLLPLPRTDTIKTEGFSPLSTTTTQSPDSYSNYQGVFEKRNVFKTIGEPPPLISNEKLVSFSELTRNFFLSGIIDGEKPQAIIEDRASGQIHYVESGDFIGSIQVVSVGSDHVILRYGDEEGQLTL